MTRFERAVQIWPVLAHCATHRQVLSYELLGRLIGVPRAGLGQLLELIQAYCLQRDLPALTSIVVSAETGLPGVGFTGAENVPAAQARVFAHNWLAESAPDADTFAAALEAAG